MKFVKAGGRELERLMEELVPRERYYNPDSACETKLLEMRDEIKEFAYNPKQKKDFKLERKLVEFYDSLNSMQGDQEIYWPRVLQLMLFFSLKA